MKTVIDIPNEIQEPQFLSFIGAFTHRFKEQQGFGRWLKEYQDMEEQGLFEPKKLKELYLQILLQPTCLDFIRRQAVRYICEQALDATKSFCYLQRPKPFVPKVKSFCILKIPEGEVATDEEGDALEGLTNVEALLICDTLNANYDENEPRFKIFEEDLAL